MLTGIRCIPSQRYPAPAGDGASPAGYAPCMQSPDWEAALDATFPAQPSQVPAIRRAVAEIARQRGAPPHTLVQIKLAVSEAATNAVQHAYRDGATPRAGDVRVVVHAKDAS